MRAARCKGVTGTAMLVSVIVFLMVNPWLCADWDPQNPQDVERAKWIQMPDLTPMGIDIRMDNFDDMPRALGDDFLCKVTGPITDIHLWTSWLGDFEAEIGMVKLSIWSDVPANPPDVMYSHPGQLLWEKPFVAGEFVIRPYWNLDPEYEWFWDPWGLHPMAPIPNGDQHVWQLNFFIDEESAFIQQGTDTQPIIYWLVVSVEINGATGQEAFGWKTRTLDEEHFNDDAVWMDAIEVWPGMVHWSELVYPPEHPYQGSVDLAFVITTEPGVTPDPCDFGDAPDNAAALGYPTLLVHNGAGHVIGGPWLGALSDNPDAEPDGQPDPAAMGDNNNGANDENGVAIPPLVAGQMNTVQVTVSNAPVGAQVNVEGWVDYDGVIGWAASEMVCDVWLTNGTFPVSFNIPAGVTVGPTFARFRVSMAGMNSPVGIAPNGEVEDYLVDISEPTYEPKPAVPNLKWSQPPIEIDASASWPTFCGWDEDSYAPYDPGMPDFAKMVADDFRCLGNMPVTSIHWWGSYVGWEGDVLPANVPDRWAIAFWTNVPADPRNLQYPWSAPGELVKTFVVDGSRVLIDNNVATDYFPGRPNDTCFQYYIDLDPCEWFWQGEYDSPDNVYWLSIVALYPNDVQPPLHPWGWKTRPWHWMDDAIVYYGDLPTETMVGMFLGPQQVTPIEGEIQGMVESYDVAFELDTDPCYVKWEQPFDGLRNWPHYEDKTSMAIELPDGTMQWGPMAADDWLCTRRTPITAVVWWGSYIGYEYQACVGDMAAPRPVKPDYFILRIWTDGAVTDPDNQYPFSHPRDIVWEYHAYNYDEVLVGYDKHPEAGPGAGLPREPVFRYSVPLPEDVWWEQEEEQGVYWLSVVAVYKNEPPQYYWGWTIHPHFFNDDAVQGGWDNMWYWQEIFDQTGTSADLSFMLFTEPECLYVGQLIGDVTVTPAIYSLWVSIGKPKVWCCVNNSMGDANLDGFTNGSDVTPILNGPLGAATTYNNANADLNRDGFVNGSDVTPILNRLGQTVGTCPGVPTWP